MRSIRWNAGIVMELRVISSFSLSLLMFLFHTIFQGGLSDNNLINESDESVLRLKSENANPNLGRIDPRLVTHLSWHPRAFLYEGFLTHKECDHLITLAEDKLERSTVVHDSFTSGNLSDVRDDVVRKIEEKIAAWTYLPPENGESLQILHYEVGQKYEPHHDYFYDNNKINQESGGHRYATVLMYLSNVTKGGETVFPNSELKMQQPKDDSWSDCAKNGYAVKPKKGDALLIFNLHPDSSPDLLSLHGSCPVVEGEKWSASKWIRERSYENIVQDGSITYDDYDCVDENEDWCPHWAREGECHKNPIYMIGTDRVSGYCRKSCDVC